MRSRPWSLSLGGASSASREVFRGSLSWASPRVPRSVQECAPRRRHSAHLPMSRPSSNAREILRRRELRITSRRSQVGEDLRDGREGGVHMSCSNTRTQCSNDMEVEDLLTGVDEVDTRGAQAEEAVQPLHWKTGEELPHPPHDPTPHSRARLPCDRQALRSQRSRARFPHRHDGWCAPLARLPGLLTSHR